MKKFCTLSSVTYCRLSRHVSFLGIVFSQMLSMTESQISRTASCHWGSNFSPWAWSILCKHWFALQAVWNQVGGVCLGGVCRRGCLRNGVCLINSRVRAENWSVNSNKLSRTAQDERTAQTWWNSVDAKSGGSETSLLRL